jgi:uncharacterized protein
MTAATHAEHQCALFDEIARRIVEVCQPQKVIVFGSRARGDHRPDSDVDILVVAESDEPRYRRAGRLYTALASLPIEVDILVYTPREIEEWSQVPQAFVTTATREGLVVYERST